MGGRNMLIQPGELNDGFERPTIDPRYSAAQLSGPLAVKKVSGESEDIHAPNMLIQPGESEKGFMRPTIDPRFSAAQRVDTAPFKS